MKISVAISKENRPPACEYLGVACSLEFDEDLTPPGPKVFQQAIHGAVVA